MLLLILESFGSTELLFILIMALIFFGPRKLPQISRSLGKSLAEFRRASEDFKRTWEREVAMENPLADLTSNDVGRPQNNALFDNNGQSDSEPATTHTIARGVNSAPVTETVSANVASEHSTETSSEANTQLKKHDWL